MNNAEQAILIISLFTGTAYSLLIIAFTIGWGKLKKAKTNTSPITQISIVVAARNEADHIDPLLQRLLSQQYPEELYEILVVNDHSADATLDILGKYQDHQRIKILDLPPEQSGKKNALSLGIQKAVGSLISTIDADCLPSQNWLKTIATSYEDGKHKMIVGPVAIQSPQGWLASFQALELLSLVSSGGGAIGIKRPIMCNGANLTYEKGAFFEVGGFNGNEHIPGGDDMFLMEKFNKQFPPGSLGFNINRESIVYTKASHNLKEFMNQRFRWVAKSPAYSNPFLITTAIIVLLFNLSLIIAMVFAFTSLPGLLIFGGLFLLKCFSDFPILWKASKFAGQTKLMRKYIPFQFVYFVFISLSGVLGNVLPFSWKGREE